MSILRNLLNAFVPVRERRETSTGALPLAIANAMITHELNGCESASITIAGGAAVLNATLEFTGSTDNINFLPVLVYPLFSVGGTALVCAQPIVSEVVNAANVFRVYNLACGNLKALRVRYSAYTAGAADVLIISESSESLHSSVMHSKPTTLIVSSTAAAGVLVNASLPAVPNLRHYIDFIRIVRSSSVALVAAAARAVIATTNLPGALAFTIGSDASPQGADKESVTEFANGLAASAINTATAVQAPAVAGVIWRINVGYRLGL